MNDFTSSFFQHFERKTNFCNFLAFFLSNKKKFVKGFILEETFVTKKKKRKRLGKIKMTEKEKKVVFGLNNSLNHSSFLKGLL